jgi:hypothetical protein
LNRRATMSAARHRLRLVLLTLLAVGAVAAAASVVTRAAPAVVGGGASPGTWCGGIRWRLMTLSDRDRRTVDLRRHPTTIADIASQPVPARVPVRRTTLFQRGVWRLQTVLDRYRIASNGEIVLVLYSIATGQYMNAYMPNPHCLGPRARDRTGMVAARRQLAACPTPTPQWFLIGATVEVAGVGFWNPVRTTRGALPNGAELRPVTNFRLIAGCGVG